MTKRGCKVPETMPEKDATIYRMFREAHCDLRQASHECSGRMSIDRCGFTLSCPLCGDARALFPKQTPTTTKENV
jgi:hypothetical protein